MNFYKRHIGDYLKDTAHLSLLEHGVYTRLLDVYYTREAGIPEAQAARLIGARTKDEMSALEAVLDEFFELGDGTWTQPRCEREINAAGPKPDGGDVPPKTGKAARQKAYRDRRKAMFERLSSLGVTLPFDASMDELQDALLRVTDASRVMPSVTPDASRVMERSASQNQNVTATISQTPDSTSQTPDITPEVPASAGGTPPARAAELSIVMRRHSIQASPHDPRVEAAAKRGITPETLEAACIEAKTAKPGERIGVAYVIAIADRWAADASRARPARSPQHPPRQTPEERRRAISKANGDAWLAETPASDPNVIDMES
ncbi:YdaU family protein [Burkholderia gladioli]|uniref:YdaU family protein n=1 Tax=Burkholderia gladioli TaxID=28095 RepID=UPI001FC897BE|nr:YdaU family protein [Burkholderia gladioli]